MEKNAPCSCLFLRDDSRIMRNRALRRRMYPVRRSFLFHLICAARHIAPALFVFSERQTRDDCVAVARPTLLVRLCKGDLAGSCRCVNTAVLRHDEPAHPPPRLQFSRGSPGWLRCVTAMMCVSEGCQSLCQESTHVRRHWLRCNSPAQIQLTFLFFFSVAKVTSVCLRPAGKGS